MIEKAPYSEISEDLLSSLIQLSSDAKFNSEKINKIDNDYLYWDKIKYISDENIDGKELWNIVKAKRLLQNRFIIIPSEKGNGLRVNYNINDLLSKKLHYLDFNFGAGLQKEQLLSDIDKQNYLNNALMEESIFSSMIEGATTTRVKAKDMLRKNNKPKNKSEQMILNNYRTIQYISEHQEENISVEKLFELHRLVTQDTLEEQEIGVFRGTNEVHVMNEITGEIVHTPPNFEELDSLMNSFCDFFNNNPKEGFIYPIAKASILHFLIGYIHPFADGNGRTARAIFYWYLLKNGYWLVEYLSISRVIMKTKVQYEKAYLYTEIDDMDVTYFIQYQIKVLMRAFEELKDYMAKKKKEQSKLLKFLKFDGINQRQATILQIIEEDNNHFFTVKEIETRFSITNQTARTDIEELVEREFLKKTAINKKTYNYWKGDKFDSTFL